MHTIFKKPSLPQSFYDFVLAMHVKVISHGLIYNIHRYQRSNL